MYIFSDLSIKFYGSSILYYDKLIDYANVQVDILIYAVNFLFLVSYVVVFSLFLKKGQV